MPLDPSIFMQGAALQNQNAANLQNQLAEGARLYYAGKKERAGLDLDKLIDPIIVKLQTGQELTPEDIAIGKAWEAKRGTEQMAGPYGEPLPKYNPLFGAATQAVSKPYQSPYAAQNAFMPSFENGSVNEDQALNDLPSVPLSPEQIEAMVAETPAGQNIDQPGPIRDTPSIADELIKGSAAYGTPVDEKTKLDTGYGILKDEAKDAREAGNPKSYTGEQAKVSGFANRMENADKIFAKLPQGADAAKTGVAGKTEAILSAIPSAGMTDRLGQGIVKMSASPEQQQYLNAAQEWIRAKLRKESGAVIGPQEMIDEYATYFPTAGDTPEVIKQKAELRKNAQETMKNESAGMYELQYGKDGVIDYQEYFK